MYIALDEHRLLTTNETPSSNFQFQFSISFFPLSGFRLPSPQRQTENQSSLSSLPALWNLCLIVCLSCRTNDNYSQTHYSDANHIPPGRLEQRSANAEQAGGELVSL